MTSFDLDAPLFETSGGIATGSDLVAALASLGIGPGDTVLIHSDVSRWEDF